MPPSTVLARNTDVTLEDLRRRLVQWRNADGGWAYYAGKRSRLEATCWSILALADVDPDVPASLAEWPTRDGLFLEQVGGVPNFAFNGLALLVLLSTGHAASARTRDLLGGLQRVKGDALQPSRASRQDNSIQAWSWVADTFSWVEPTACCLLAMKCYARRTGRPIDMQRVRDAERMLQDRVCRSGGWNYGNSNVLGTELHPYVPTTALALLALQDQGSAAWVVRSVDWLAAHALTERSSLALALTVLALDVHGRRTSDVRQALLENLPITLNLGQVATLAMAICALSSDHAPAAFVL